MERRKKRRLFRIALGIGCIFLGVLVLEVGKYRAEQWNRFVEQELCEVLPFLNKEDVSFDVDYSIERKTGEYCSILCQGVYVVKSDLPRSNQFAAGLILDLENRRTVSLQELIGADGLKEIEEMILQGNFEITWGALKKEEDNPLDIRTVIEGQPCFQGQEDFGSFFVKEKDKIGVIVRGLPQAAGNYSILEVGYALLPGF